MSDLEKTGVKLVAEGQNAFASAMDSAERSVKDFERSAGSASGGVSAFSEIATGALRRIGEVALDALGQAAQAAGKFAADSVTAAGEFEASLNTFAAVTGKSMEKAGLDLQDFSALFLDMGAKTQFSAGQAAEAAIELAKGGLDPATIAAGALEQALSLAAASGMKDLGQASEIMAKQLGGWGDTGVQAAEVANLLAQAANASTVDVDELALGLANVGGSAKVVGATFEETVQTLALLAPGFSSASDAGTSLKTFLSRLVPATDKAKDAMADLGLVTEDGNSVFFDAKGNFVGMEQAARLLQTATQGLTNDQKLLAFNTIFGQDAIRTAAMLAESGAAGFNQMGVAMADAGTAAEQSAIRNQGFAFAMESLKGSIETVQIALGTVLLPTITGFVNTALIPAVNGVLAFIQAAQASGDPIAFLGQQFAAATPMLQPLYDAVQSLAAAFAESWPRMQQYVADAFAFIQGLIGIAGPQIVANVTAAVNVMTGLWQRHGEEIMAFVNGAFRFIATTISVALTAVSGLLTAFMQARTGDWSGFWNTIVTTAQNIMNQILSIVGMDLDKFTAIWHTVLFEQLPLIVTNGLNQAAQAAQAMLDGFVGIGQAIVDALVGAVSEGASRLAQAAADIVIGAINAAKSAAGIKSPSRLARKEVGQPIAEGMELGIWDKAARVAAAGGALSMAAITPPMPGRQITNSAVYNTNYSRVNNLTVNSAQSSQGVIRDFYLMDALTGAA